MPNSLLRHRRSGRRAEVTSVELFFDLVFVIAVTQISHGLLDHLTWLGALEATMLLLAVWFAWIDTAWITNWLDPNKPLVRLMMFVLMGIGLVLTSSLPEAFAERGLAFATAYAVFQIGRTLFMLWAVRSDKPLFRNFLRILVWCVAGAIFWLIGGFLDGGMRLMFWLIAVGLDVAAPAAGFRVPGLGTAVTRDWSIDGGHMAERAGLFVLIALGESVLATGVGFTELEWSRDVILTMAASLLQSIAIWTIYFGEHAERASAVIAKSADPGAVGRRAYTYVPIFLVAGIIVCAVGDELALAHASGHTDPAAAFVLVGGPALFLLGAILFKLAVFGVWSKPRLTGLAALAVTGFFASQWTPLEITVVTTLIMVGVAAVEAVWLAQHPQPREDDALAAD